jgi:AraC-like DNA-binding protein
VNEWIRVHASATLSVRTVAAHFGYSADHLSRICKKQYGVGAGALIDRFLLSRAKELLCNTDAYVKEIAAALGFATDKAFIGYFKYHEGCFPAAFRARFAKMHMNNK